MPLGTRGHPALLGWAFWKAFGPSGSCDFLGLPEGPFINTKALGENFNISIEFYLEFRGGVGRRSECQ